jgi:hypothetical protein
MMLPVLVLALTFESQIVDAIVLAITLLCPNLPAKIIQWFSCLAIAASLAVAPLQAQEAPPTYVLPVLPWDGPGEIAQQGTGLAFIPAVIVVGVGVGVVGWLGFKVVNKIMDLDEFIVTNNAAQPGPLVMNRTFIDYVDHGFTAIPEFSIGPSTWTNTEPAQAPSPIDIDYSDDGTNWVNMLHGVAVGDEWQMPDTGYWRAVVLPSRITFKDGAITVLAPPGVLEISQDLVHWQTHSVNWTDTELTASPGVFYRVKL